MTCLEADRIYAYLDGELTEQEATVITAHLACCRECREAVESRRRLDQAARALPALPVPTEFSGLIMRRVQLELIPLRDFIISASLGFAAMMLTMLTVFIWSGQSLFDFLIGLNHTALNGLQGIIVTCVKLSKTLLLILRVFRHSLRDILESLARSATMLDPAIQAAAIFSLVMLSAGLILLIHKKFVIGDRQ